MQNDCFLDAPIGAPIRLRFTCIAGFALALCRRHALGMGRIVALDHHRAAPCGHTHGPAEILYCDNGKDYLKVAKGAMPGYLRESEEAAAKWYARRWRRWKSLACWPDGHGGAALHRAPSPIKHVERFFRTVHARFDKKFPTYTGGSPARRPDFTEAHGRTPQRRLLRMGRPGMRIAASAGVEVIRMWLAWIDDYHRQPHSGKGMNGRSPFEVLKRSGTRGRSPRLRRKCWR